MKRLTTLLAVFVVVLGLFAPEAFGQRGFGRSGGFGGGGFGRSSGGFGRSGGFSSPRSYSGSSGSFNRSRSSSSTFGGGSFNRSSSSTFGRSGPTSSSSGFGRSGSFGSTGRINSTSINRPPIYRDSVPTYTGYGYYGGSRVPAYGYGFFSGYSLGMLSNPWLHYAPWHPAFYYGRPMYYDGAYHAGEFSFFRLIFGIAIIVFVVWLIAKILRLIGGGGIKYTTYR